MNLLSTIVCTIMERRESSMSKCRSSASQHQHQHAHTLLPLAKLKFRSTPYHRPRRRLCYTNATFSCLSLATAGKWQPVSYHFPCSSPPLFIFLQQNHTEYLHQSPNPQFNNCIRRVDRKLMLYQSFKIFFFPQQLLGHPNNSSSLSLNKRKVVTPNQVVGLGDYKSNSPNNPKTAIETSPNTNY